MATEIPSTMIAARVSEYGKGPELVKIPVPEPKPNQVLVKCTYGGFCHTDLQSLDGDNGAPLPLTLGHEPVGHVVKLGKDVSGFELGQRVGFMNPLNTCGECHECSEGNFIYCDSDKATLAGVSDQGCFSEYAVADSQFTFAIPDDIDSLTACTLMCAGVTTFNALKRADVPIHGTLAVIGCGGLGTLLTQFAVAMGVKVVAVDTKQIALDLAKTFGASFCVKVDPDSDMQNVRKQVQAVTNGRGADSCVIVTDAVPTIQVASAICKKHATVVLVGAPVPPWPIHCLDLLFRDLRFKGSLLANPDVCKEMLQVASKNNIKSQCTVYPFEKVKEMIHDYRKGQIAGRLVLQIS